MNNVLLRLFYYVCMNCLCDLFVHILTSRFVSGGVTVSITWLFQYQWSNPDVNMMTSSNGKIFRVTGPLCGEFTVPVKSPHKCQWRGAFMLSSICVWINGWVNKRGAGDLRRHRAHYDGIVIKSTIAKTKQHTTNHEPCCLRRGNRDLIWRVRRYLLHSVRG